MPVNGDWQAVEGELSKDIETKSKYLQTWKLKLTTAKTMSAVFHLNNKEANLEPKVDPMTLSGPFAPSTTTSEQFWTGRSHTVDTSIHFAKS